MNAFEKAIENHLKLRGFQDPLFAETLKKPNKSLKECCNYIINEVQKTGRIGFEDDEIFSLAIHYYDEDDITSEDAPRCSVVVNTKIELTDEEVQKAKQEAINEVIMSKKKEMLEKPKKAKSAELKKENVKTLF